MWPGIPDTYQKLPESDSGSFRYTRSRDYQTRPVRPRKTYLYKFRYGHTEIYANILFHRLVVLAQQQANVAERFTYELTPYPAALFKDGFMCKPVETNMSTVAKRLDGPLGTEVRLG